MPETGRISSEVDWFENDGIVAEATNSIFSQRHALLLKREIFDRGVVDSPLQLL